MRGFVMDSGKRYSISTRFISQRAIQMQNYAHLYLIDYAKSFDKVQYKERFKQLLKLDIFANDIRIIQIF